MFGKIDPQEGTSAHALPQMNLRERTDQHPMAMFAIIVSAAFISFALMPSTKSAFAAPSAQPARMADVIADGARTTAKSDRLPAANELAKACEGQTWGDESLDCLLQIARAGGKEGSLRMVADAQPMRTTPNVF
jgi:hypothetical protein